MRSATPTRPGTGPTASAPVPPRPSHRPPIPPRPTGAPVETASETTFRLRPIPADPPPESDSRRRDAEAYGRTGPTGVGGPRGSDGRPDSAPGSRTGSGTSGAPSGTRPGGSAAPVPPGFPPRPERGPAVAGNDSRASSAGGMGPSSATAGEGRGPRIPSAPTAPPRSTATAGADSTVLSPDPSLSWSAPMAPGGVPGAARPVVSFGEPEGYDDRARPRPLGVWVRPRVAAAAACFVLGLGLIGGALTGSWLIGDPRETGPSDTFAAAGGLWHSVPVDQLFPPTVEGQGAGPGGADRTWTRIAVAPDSGCKGAFDPLLRKALGSAGCERLLRATYTDATQSYVTTVGLLFTKADAAAMTSLSTRFKAEGLGKRTDLMPRPYAAKDTVAADFGPEQRASWTVSVLTEAPVVVYAVSGWADGRTVDDPQPAEEAMKSGTTTAPAQAGLGNEAQGLADRIERGLRKTVSSPTEKPS
ncbi:hypothetical protein ABT063_19790 [Streptomyces sp. NPDC002838]|uniref:hypothetical protein n=1 Tax=Streptomyces sp. NPDC002838 TaxID=3154436 RepID=UPI003318C194